MEINITITGVTQSKDRHHRAHGEHRKINRKEREVRKDFRVFSSRPLRAAWFKKGILVNSAADQLSE
jgi:hypothetical protein